MINCYVLFCLLMLAYSVLCENAIPRKKNEKIVLISGASSGIGKSAAEEFIRHPNFKVWATMRNPEKSALPHVKDGRLVVIGMDVKSPQSVESAVQRIIEVDGRIDVVINNAGYGVAGCLEMVKIEEALDLFDVNVWGAVRVIQAALPHMRKRRFGHIINISSTSGIRGIPCMDVYTGSKFALEGMMDSLRYSISPFNISITNVNAGPIKTKFVEKMQASEGRGSRDLIDDETFDYFHVITSGMISGLNHRLHSAEAQSSEEFAHVLVNIVNLKLASKRITDVPFNIGSNRESQSLLEQVKKLPTGWGGLYNEILQIMPPVKETLHSISSQKEEM